MSNGNVTDPMHDLEVSLWIGKGGVTAGIIEELNAQLESNEFVKVRVLRSALGTQNVEEVATMLSEKCSGNVIDTRGHTAVIAR